LVSSRNSSACTLMWKLPATRCTSSQPARLQPSCASIAWFSAFTSCAGRTGTAHHHTAPPQAHAPLRCEPMPAPLVSGDRHSTSGRPGRSACFAWPRRHDSYRVQAGGMVRAEVSRYMFARPGHAASEDAPAGHRRWPQRARPPCAASGQRAAGTRRAVADRARCGSMPASAAGHMPAWVQVRLSAARAGPPACRDPNPMRPPPRAAAAA